MARYPDELGPLDSLGALGVPDDAVGICGGLGVPDDAVGICGALGVPDDAVGICGATPRRAKRVLKPSMAQRVGLPVAGIFLTLIIGTGVAQRLRRS